MSSPTRRRQRGGGCGCMLQSGGARKRRGTRRAQRGGECPCTKMFGGYRATKKNLMYLKRWKRGESIGFTMTASLKAKGLIPRTSRKHRGKKVLGPKYR